MIKYFEWTKDISVGNVDIDFQHQRLLEQINKILNELISGISHEEVIEAINFLDRYIQQHFTYEEEFMSKINYPQIEEHKIKHHEFIQKYYEFKSDLNKGVSKDKLILEIESYIGEWWVNHIGKEDKKYHLFLEEQNKK